MAIDDIVLRIQLRDMASRALAGVNQGLRGMQSAVDSASAKIFNLKNSLAGLGAGLALADVTKTFASFDDQMRSVGAIAQASDEQLAVMTETAKKLGSTTSFSASEAAKGLQFLSMAGLDAREATEALPGVLEMAAANSMELADAADIATNVMSGMGMKISELSQINDALSKTATSANTDVLQLGEAMKIAAPAARASGTDIETVSAVLGGLANNAIRGAQSGHAFKRMMMLLQNPSEEAVKTLAEMGVSTLDAAGNFRGIIPILQDLNANNMTLTESTKIFKQETAAQAIAAAGAAPKITELEGSLRGLEGGFAAAIAAEKESGLGGAIRALQSAWEGMKISFGEGFDTAMTEVFRVLTGEIQNAITWIEEMKRSGQMDEWVEQVKASVTEAIQNFKRLIQIIITAADTFSPLISKATELSPVLVPITAALVSLGGALKLIIPLFSIFSSGLSLISAGLGATGITAFIASLSRASQALGLAQAATASLGAALATAGAAVAAFFAGWQVGKIISASDAFGLLPKSVGQYTQDAFGILDAFFQQAKVGFASVGQVIAQAFGAEGSASMFAGMADSAQASMDRIEQTIPVVGALRNAFSGLGERFQIAFGGIDELISRAKIKLLELRRAYNEWTGDQSDVTAIDAAIAQEERHIQAIRQTVAAIGEKPKAAQDAATKQAETATQVVSAEERAWEQIRQVMEAGGDIRVKAAEQAAKKSVAVTEAEADKKLGIMNRHNTEAKAAYMQRIEDIESAEKTGALTYEQALDAKLAADAQFYRTSVEKAKSAAAAAAAAYGEGSKEYRRAQKAKKAALAEWVEREEAAHERIRSLDEQLSQSRKSSEEKIRALRRKSMSEYQAYNDKVAEVQEKISAANKLAETDTKAAMKLYKEAQQAATEVSNEVMEGEKVVVSQQKAVDTAIKLVEQAQAGIENAVKSQQAAIESAMSGTQESAETAKEATEEVGHAVAATEGRVISIETDGQMAIQQVDEINEKLAQLKDKQFSVSVDTSAASSQLSGLERQAAALQAKLSKMKSTTEFKGKASPELPLSQTISNITSKLEAFRQNAAQGSSHTMTVTGDIGGGPQPYTSATNALMAEYDAISEQMRQKELRGEVSLAGKQGSFQQQAELLKQTFDQLYNDLGSGISAYQQQFSGVLKGVTSDTQAMAAGSGAATEKMSMDMSLLSSDAEQFGKNMRTALVSGNQEAYDKITASLNEYGGEFSETMESQIESAKKMADEVISSGEDMIQALSQRIASLGDEIKRIDSEIANLGKSTEEKIRQLQQNMMTEEEKWLDDRLAAQTRYQEAQAAQQAGEFEKAKALFLESQSLAESLAREVTNAEGEVVRTLADTTTDAIAMVEKAGSGAESALKGQQGALQGQQDSAREELKKTEQVVESVREMSATMTTQLEEMMGSFKSSIGEMVSALSEGIKKSISSAMETVSKGMQKMSVDTSKYDEKIFKIKEQIRKAEADWSLNTGSKTREGRIMHKAYLHELREALKDVNAEAKHYRSFMEGRMESRVDFTGTGSSKKPITEKIREISGKMKGFLSEAKDAPVNADFSQMDQGIQEIARKMSESLSGTITDISMPNMQAAMPPGTPAAGGFDLRDFGKVDISAGGRGGTVLGKPDVIRWIKDAISQERRRGQD